MLSYHEIELPDIQREPERILALGLTSLAWLTHEAEHTDDDLTFIAICNEVERREIECRGARGIWRTEYLRLWPEHARARGYG